MTSRFIYFVININIAFIPFRQISVHTHFLFIPMCLSYCSVLFLYIFRFAPKYICCYFFFQRDVYFRGSKFRTSPACIHALENKSCVQVVLFCVPYWKTIEMEPYLPELKEIQREGYEWTSAPPPPSTCFMTIPSLHSCSSARWREGARAWKGGK